MFQKSCKTLGFLEIIFCKIPSWEGVGARVEAKLYLSHGLYVPSVHTFDFTLFSLSVTVKPVLSGHSKVEKINILMTNGSLMKDESIAECSPRSILQYL